MRPIQVALERLCKMHGAPTADDVCIDHESGSWFRRWTVAWLDLICPGLLVDCDRGACKMCWCTAPHLCVVIVVVVDDDGCVHGVCVVTPSS